MEPFKNSKRKKDKKYNCLNTKLNRQVINTMIKAYDMFEDLYPVYDGKSNLYTRHQLRISDKFKCKIALEQRSLRSNDLMQLQKEYFKVVLKPSIKKDGKGCAINLEPLHALFAGQTMDVQEEALMALEIVLRNTPCMRYIPVGRSFFYPPNPDNVHPIGGGREILFGYHQSIRLGEFTPMVNLDTTTTVFYKNRPLLEYVAEEIGTTVEGLGRISNIQAHQLHKMNKELKNLKIEVTHLQHYRRKYRIEENLTEKGANRLSFVSNGVEITVAQYFARTYGPLRFPHLPCVQINSKAKGRPTVYLPIEVCEIVSQHCNKELTPNQVTEMIKFSAKSPAERFKEIEGVFTEANFGNDRHLKEFEMKVLPQPLRTEARVLNAPNLRYDKEEKARPVNGAWNMIGKKYYEKAKVESWVLLNFANECDNRILELFSESLTSMANSQGIQMDKRKQILHIDSKIQNAQDIILEMKRKNVHLVVIVLPTDKGNMKKDRVQSKTLYNAIKRVAETAGLSLITQCITANNVLKLRQTNRNNPTLLSNICLKINTKMGGINHLLTPGETPILLSEKNEPVIVMGADINHPGPTADKNPKPSLAAVVGSLDSNASRYAVSIRSQINEKRGKQVEEIMRGLKEMVIELLKEFYRHTRQKPQKIIFYRDGVSEGQIKDVQKHEIKGIREACKAFGDDYKPGITYVIVQKRHHVKLMPEDMRRGVGAMNNVPPGTVADTTITHPLRSDFYLCSSFGLKGTSRPGYYTVVTDDNHLTADQLQKLTYFLCHTFSRCTRSISLPAPVQYAHLAAYRARQHLLSKEEG